MRDEGTPVRWLPKFFLHALAGQRLTKPPAPDWKALEKELTKPGAHWLALPTHYERAGGPALPLVTPNRDSASVRTRIRDRVWGRDEKECAPSPWRIQSPLTTRGVVLAPDDRSFGHFTSKPRTKFSPRGNLSHTDYQFWTGSPEVSAIFARCRYCHEVVCTTEMHDHKVNGLAEPYNREQTCARRIQLAFKRLAIRGTCVQCGVYTPRMKWGVPLCDGSCEYDFMFVFQEPAMIAGVLEPAPVRAAMRRAGSSNRVKPEDWLPMS